MAAASALFLCKFTENGLVNEKCEIWTLLKKVKGNIWCFLRATLALNQVNFVHWNQVNRRVLMDGSAMLRSIDVLDSSINHNSLSAAFVALHWLPKSIASPS